MLLERLGFGHVDAACNARSAVSILSRQDFDLVLCDIAMPGGSGPDLMAELLGPMHGVHASQPVWLWTSELGQDIIHSHVELARAIGLLRVGALPKPLAFELLSEVIDGFLGSGAAEAPSKPDFGAVPAGLPDLDALEVYLQPQVRLSDGCLVGAEVLSRWRHPRFGMISPMLFWPRIEAAGLAHEVLFDSWRCALAVQHELRAHQLAISLGFNASAQTLCRDGLIGRLDDMVSESRLPRSLFTIELTEGYPVADFRRLSIALNRLRLLGYGVSIDDFGVGIATLKLLADLPVTQIKLDRGFVAGVGVPGHHDIICRNIVSLAEDLGIESVAEGVETELQRDALADMGCRTGQGYLWSPPVSVPVFMQLALKGDRLG